MTPVIAKLADPEQAATDEHLPVARTHTQATRAEIEGEPTPVIAKLANLEGTSTDEQFPIARTHAQATPAQLAGAEQAATDEQFRVVRTHKQATPEGLTAAFKPELDDVQESPFSDKSWDLIDSKEQADTKPVTYCILYHLGLP